MIYSKIIKSNTKHEVGRNTATPALFSLIRTIFSRVISLAGWGYYIFKPLPQITSGMESEQDSGLKEQKMDSCDDGATEVDSPFSSPEVVLYSSKKVSFARKVKVVLIPCINEYKEVGIQDNMWCSLSEMQEIADNFRVEVAPFIDEEKRTVKEAVNQYIKHLFWQHHDCKSERILNEEYATLEKNTLSNKIDLKLN
jgi:hypothetical protein